MNRKTKAQTTPPNPLRNAPPARVRLRIMATSDMHMHLAAYDYFTARPCHHKGLALTASLIATARAEVPGALLFDNGDFLQGSPLGDYLVQSAHQPNPALLAMNHLEYDAVNIGNHEFSFGINYLRQSLAQAAFPCLSANTHHLPNITQADPFLPPTALLTRDLADATGTLHRVTVGVIGVVPPQTMIWDRQAINGQVQMTDMVAAVALHAPRLRAEGADLVIVLAHSGIGAPDPGPMAENAALAIASLTGVDAVVMGHVHLAFPGPDIPPSPGIDPVAGTLAGKPAVMPGVFGSHLGVIDLDLDVGGGTVRIAAHRSEARPIAPRDARGQRGPLADPDAALTALTAPAHDAALLWARKPIGKTPCAIHSYFALITHSHALQLVARAQAQHVASRLSGGPYHDIPLLSATAPFKAGGRAGPDNYCFIPKGDLVVCHAADLYPHPNTIVALRVTGAEVRNWLVQSSLVFNRLIPGRQDQMLLNPDVASFNFDLISGVTYRIDLAADPTSGARITDLAWQGRPVAEDDPFILATNSYRSSGSGGFLGVSPPRIVLADRMANRDVLISYLAGDAHLADLPPLSADAPADWFFAPCPGASALFDSAPESLGFSDQVAHLSLTPVGLTPQGFQRYRLAL
jgi:2',3'-cyclic-nucleotide 2'-phosphodiesterase/3'-nucleotidase